MPNSKLTRPLCHVKTMNLFRKHTDKEISFLTMILEHLRKILVGYNDKCTCKVLSLTAVIETAGTSEP